MLYVNKYSFLSHKNKTCYVEGKSSEKYGKGRQNRVDKMRIKSVLSSETHKTFLIYALYVTPPSHKSAGKR